MCQPLRASFKEYISRKSEIGHLAQIKRNKLGKGLYITALDVGKDTRLCSFHNCIPPDGLNPRGRQRNFGRKVVNSDWDERTIEDILFLRRRIDKNFERKLERDPRNLSRSPNSATDAFLIHLSQCQSCMEKRKIRRVCYEFLNNSSILSLRN